MSTPCFNRAVSMGSKVTMPLDNQFWATATAKSWDPFGHHWGVAQHVEDVAPDEMKRRMDAAMAAQAAKAAGQN